MSSSSFLFFPSSSSDSSLTFYLFSLISHFCPFFFPFLIFLFFSFPNLHHFLNLVCHFLRAPLPCSRTFCCPELTKLLLFKFQLGLFQLFQSFQISVFYTYRFNHAFFVVAGWHHIHSQSGIKFRQIIKFILKLYQTNCHIKDRRQEISKEVWQDSPKGRWDFLLAMRW